MEIQQYEMESERLRFRRLRADDYALIAPILQDEQTMYAWEHGFTYDEVCDWIADMLRRYQQDGCGYFAALVGAVASHPALYDELGIDFKYRDSFKVSACVLLSGLFDPVRSIGTRFPSIALYVKALLGVSSEELVQYGSRKGGLPCAADAYADHDFPPSFIVASKADRLKKESEALAEELKNACVKYGYFTCTGVNGVHAGALACELARSGRECLKEAQAFVAEVFAEKKKKEESD